MKKTLLIFVIIRLNCENLELEKIESIPLFGVEDTLSLRSIAEEMIELVTSFKSEKNHYKSHDKNYADGSANHISSYNDINDTYANVLSSYVAKNKTAACTTYGDNESCSVSRAQEEALQHQASLQGQQLSQMHSFDTMASRVSAPDLMMLDQISLSRGQFKKNQFLHHM